VELLSEESLKIDALNLKFNDISLYMKNNSEQRLLVQSISLSILFNDIFLNLILWEIDLIFDKNIKIVIIIYIYNV